MITHDGAKLFGPIDLLFTSTDLSHIIFFEMGK